MAASRVEGATCKQRQPGRGPTDGQCTALNACHSGRARHHPLNKVFRGHSAIDDGIVTLLRYGEGTRALRELETCPPLTIFGQRDHGALLAIAGLTRRSIQFDIGNPFIASKMTRHQLPAGLYAAIRGVLREDDDGGAIMSMQ